MYMYCPFYQITRRPSTIFYVASCTSTECYYRQAIHQLGRSCIKDRLTLQGRTVSVGTDSDVPPVNHPPSLSLSIQGAAVGGTSRLKVDPRVFGGEAWPFRTPSARFFPQYRRTYSLRQTLNAPRRCIEGIFQPMNTSIIQLSLVTGVNERVHPALASHLRAFGAESNCTHNAPGG